MDFNAVKQLIELGWPTIITVFFAYLAIQYIADQRSQINKLWARIAILEGEMIAVKEKLIDGQLRLR